MLAVFFAKLVGDALGLSVYDTHIKIKGAPVLVLTQNCCTTTFVVCTDCRNDDMTFLPCQTIVGRLQWVCCPQPEADMQLRQALVADKLTAGELMCTSLVALPPVVPLRALLATLRGCRHASFPVTEDPATAAQPGQVTSVQC